MNFSEFHTDQTFESPTYQVREEEILEFAGRFDPQPFHVDRASIQATKWGGLIASGWHTCAIAMRLAVDMVLKQSDSSGSPGLEYLKWPAPVRAGDTLRLTIRVLSTRHSKSGKFGVVRWQWLVHNQHEQIVLDLVAASLFGLSAGVAK